MKNNSFNLLELVFYYVIIFFLLREWLVPLLELTNTGFIGLMMLFIALCLAMTLIRIHLLLSWSIKFLYIVWFIVYVYGQMSVFTIDGIQFLLSDLQFNVSYILQAEWWKVTDPFKTFLFLILLWMLVYLIHHWVNVRMSIYVFLLLTVIFVAALDTFTPYDGYIAIIRVIFLGLVLSASLLIKQLMHNKSVNIRFSKYINLVIPIVFLVAFVSGVAFLIPKPEQPKWPDPVPFIKAATGKGGPVDSSEHGVKKVGYGDNDEQLGGGFVADDTVVFLAEASSKQYWRVETKDTYTSKGWENTFQSIDVSTYYSPGDPISYSLPVGPEEDSEIAKIQNLSNYNFVVQPYGLMSVEIVDDSQKENAELRLLGSEKLYANSYAGNKESLFSSYFVQYSSPTFLYSDLLKTTASDWDYDNRYLQLPDTLPDRVRNLASEIVSGKKSAYEQARAIETYFKQNGFKYETDDIAVPEEDQDYVDQFLFETKVGYCDNFSTSMVVMLRSIGIPARWVKGFSPGEIIGTNGDIRTYKVTNNNAHSWVEAYLPDVGWVNFEPTIGFAGNRNVELDNQTSPNQQDDELIIQERVEKEEVIKKEEKELKKITSPKTESQFSVNFKKFVNDNKLLLIICLGIILVAGFIVFLLRRKWLPKLYVRLQRKKKFDETTFESYYLNLLKILEMKGFKRKQGQTLDAYAKELDTLFKSNHMSLLTKSYEQLIYSNTPIQLDKLEMKECWEYLIKRTTS